MTSKPGDVRWWCYQDSETGKIEYWQYVCRSVQNRWNIPKHMQTRDRAKTCKTMYAYWVWKNDTTWGKVSTKAGDYGWTKFAGEFRERHRAANPPYSATKRGAIAVEIAGMRADMRDKDREQYDDVLPDEELLKRLLRAQKRLKA